MTSVQRESSEDELYTSWFRVAETTETDFPAESKTGPAPFVDLDGSPIFIGSALMERSVHPCKIGPRLEPSCVSVPYNGTELNHHGRYDLLPYSEQEMEWVPTSHGRIPKGRRPVLGGHDENSNRLYHAAAYIDDIKVPGLTAEHLYVLWSCILSAVCSYCDRGGANFSFNRQEYTISKNYDLL